jgi:CRP/FNR family transcriptional regulator
MRLGHFKTLQINLRGEQQITDLQMAGELLGLDAIGTYHLRCGV